ncbi:MAG: hypothetical protein WHT46_00330 [Candidatus Geothermincolales bacterium]
MSGKQRPESRTSGENIKRIGILSNPMLKLASMITVAMAIAFAIAMIPGIGTLKGDKALVSKALGDDATLAGGHREMAVRVMDQRFQASSETEDLLRNIPVVDVWVLNDPFYPLMGEIGTLQKKDGTLSSKQWQMLGFPEYETESGTTTAPTTTPTSPTPVTSGLPQNVVLVKDIYEVRGIKYATIKVNDQTYDRLKPGSEFANVFKVMEIKESSVVLQCGDEVLEIPENQVRKI